MSWRNRLKSFFEVFSEETEIETFSEVIEGSRLRGFNLWILGFAMIIACIGLNIDSISAVIGAMLISPLMGPIQGFAFAWAIQDIRLKKISIYNWIVMTVISLAASTIFFILTPFDFNTTQLSAFKSATIFDILLAFFGGMAGFLGIMKKDGTKIIAGVAVATACMPPLCTAGYGIAHLDWKFTLGGMYFYLINCFFIGLATFILARFFEIHKKLNRAESSLNSKSASWYWGMLIFLITIPGLYLAYIKWNEEKVKIKFKSDSERIIDLEKKVNTLDSLLHLSTKN